jgi:energy-coupling factor transporter ATP-binding protein EcfA2
MLSLCVVQHLANRLQQENICYCHWKSNEHLDAAVQGKTDLDVLVDRTEKTKLKQVLSEVGFKYFEAIPCRKYVDIDDYLAIDSETGTLVHLHLHYVLELGEKQLKGYDIPWDKLLLSSRIYNDEHHFYTAEPHIETILLIVRATLKTRTRDRLKSILGHDYFKGDFIREFRWLKQRIDLNEIKQLSERLLGADAASLILEVINDESHLKKLLRYDNPIQAALKPYRRYHPLVALRLRWGREFENLLYKVLNRYFDAPVTTRRTPVNGGRMIGILGADGSGKSTVANEVVKCLSQKLDVLPIYLGSGDGKVSWLRLPLVWANKLAKTLQSKRRSPDASHGSNAEATDGEKDSKPKSKLSNLVQMLWATTLVYEKQGKLKQSSRAKQRGMIVISDRYPQTQFLGFNDGPLLTNGLSNGRASAFPPALQQWEIESYQHMAEQTPPDLIIKLNVTPEVALARKADSPADVVRQKVAAVQALQFAAPTTVVEIDATQPLQDVLREAKRAVWQSL